MDMLYNIYLCIGLLLMLIVMLGLVLLWVVLYLVVFDVLYFVVWGDGGSEFLWMFDDYNCVVNKF